MPRSAGSQRQGNPEALDLQRFLVLPTPPQIVAGNTEEITKARRLMANLRPSQMLERPGAQFVNANALPWIAGSNEGRKFLASDASRVLVRGAPGAFCPVAVSETGNAPVPDLAARALERCLAASAPKCGCEVIAAGSVLMVPRDEVNYATGIAARIRARSLGLDGFLIAEETANGEILLRDVSRVIGRVQRNGDGKVTLNVGRDLVRFAGESRKVGFRRGRLAERIYATDAEGNRLSLLIGFDPEELAQLAGAWLAWPEES